MVPLLTFLLALDLASLEREPNLEKRSELAMKMADTAVTAVRDATQKADDPALKAALDEVRASIDAAVSSLEKSGVKPRNSKYYKKAELAAGQLLRRLDGLLRSVSVVDQEAIQPVRDHISEVHDKLLADIMRKK
jgi:glutamyl-tRNA reductase